MAKEKYHKIVSRSLTILYELWCLFNTMVLMWRRYVAVVRYMSVPVVTLNKTYIHTHIMLHRFWRQGVTSVWIVLVYLVNSSVRCVAHYNATAVRRYASCDQMAALSIIHVFTPRSDRRPRDSRDCGTFDDKE